MDIKGKIIVKNVVIYFNIVHSAMDRSSEQRNYIPVKTDLSSQNSPSSPCRAHVLSLAHVTFSRLDHPVVLRSILNSFQNGIYYHPIPDHNIIHLHNNNKIIIIALETIQNLS